MRTDRVISPANLQSIPLPFLLRQATRYHSIFSGRVGRTPQASASEAGLNLTGFETSSKSSANEPLAAKEKLVHDHGLVSGFKLLRVVSLGATLDRLICFHSLPPEFHQFAERRITFPPASPAPPSRTAPASPNREPELRDRKNLRLEALANQLAANPNPRKIRPRWNISDQFAYGVFCHDFDAAGVAGLRFGHFTRPVSDCSIKWSRWTFQLRRGSLWINGWKGG